MIFLRSRVPTLALLLAMVAGRAAAQEPELDPKSATESAWSKGVPEESRQAAEALFKEGNALLRESITISAATMYREALARWDHPNIHYNLALALMSLDQPIETHAHLVAAMKYGPEPLQQERFEHARNYLALLERQLARVRVRSEVPGARVELDGETLFTAPGDREQLVRAGRHTVAASKEGYVTNSAVRTLEGGQTTSLDLDLRTLEELTTVRRRWSAWGPWSLVGAGVVVALTGGALQLGGAELVDRIDRESRERCPLGCATEPADLASDRDRGATMQKLAMGAYGVGGVAIAGGALLVYLNRAERFVRGYESGQPVAPPRSATFQLSPSFDGDRPGVVATVRY
jgi:hypothetical protein